MKKPKLFPHHPPSWKIKKKEIIIFGKGPEIPI
jgi:hypothetical protein